MTCPRPLLLAGLCASFVAACADEPARKNIDDFLTYRPLTERVDPLIGSRGPGNVVPGALVPHGAVKLSPDTLGPNGTIDAYEHADEKIEGFSHTHLEGPGGSFSGYSQLLVMATRGEIAPDEAGYASRYSHDTEEASPGYYAVDLTDANVRAELTATSRCGVHRYTFRGEGPGNLLLDVAHSRGGWVGGSVEIVGDHVIRGTGHYDVHPLVSLAVRGFQREGTTAQRTIHFHAEISRPFGSFGTWTAGDVSRGAASATTGDIGAFASWTDAASAPIEVRICLSSIDQEQAGARSRRRSRAGRSRACARRRASNGTGCSIASRSRAGPTPSNRCSIPRCSTPCSSRRITARAAVSGAGLTARGGSTR